MTARYTDRGIVSEKYPLFMWRIAQPVNNSSSTTAQFAPRLLTWFEQHGRHDLPWQQDKTPYRVWLSEIMLQQTQVQTVIPYFLRFVAQYPTVEQLAAASEDEVLHLWTGLGYYARARNLHRAARCIVADHGGVFPADVETLEQLPGIGRSTAGAIASLAMDVRAAILDGNVKRVLARHDAVAGWPGSAKTLAELWRLAELYTPEQRVADYNQGMMDLGATLCTRQNPRCEHCPVSGTCLARERSEQHLFPGRKPRRTLPERETHFLVFRRPDGAVLLQKRPGAGIWGGLWCFPEAIDPEQPPAALAQLFESETGQRTRLDPIQHSFSHYRLTILPVMISIEQTPERIAEVDSVRWVTPGGEIPLGLPAPVARLLAALAQTR